MIFIHRSFHFFLRMVKKNSLWILWLQLLTSAWHVLLKHLTPIKLLIATDCKLAYFLFDMHHSNFFNKGMCLMIRWCLALWRQSLRLLVARIGKQDFLELFLCAASLLVSSTFNKQQPKVSQSHFYQVLWSEEEQQIDLGARKSLLLHLL